jgi:uncharacterized protein (TIGR04141 family)
MDDIPTNKLSIYLIKDSYSDHKSILKNFDKLTKEEIKDGAETIGTLYYGDSHLFEPSWIKDFFGSSFENNRAHNTQDENRKLKLFNASSKAVLLIEHQNKVFAIPFGYGWNLLNHGVWEERFGLKTTLNAVDANNLRRIDKKNMSSIPKDTSEQLSREGVAADFGIDIEQDLIQSITGKSKDDAFGKSITGKDALSVSVKVDLPNIKDFLGSCYQKYSSDDYKKDFGWIDQIAEVKDLKLIEKLNDKMIDNIKNDQVEKTWMAVPELVDWADVSGFSYKNSTRDTSRQDDIHLPDFLDSLSEDDRNDLSVEIFKRKRVFCFSAQNDQIKHQWSAYNCLYCETNDESEEKTYLLSNGKWYEVEKDFSKQVDSDYQALRGQETSFNLPIYQHKNEGDYNEKIAENDNQFCCMDGPENVIPHGGGYSKIEFCDLLTKDKKIIHVKHYGGSSVLSHLFSQGVVSGELFIADKEFRKKVNEKLSDSHKIDNTESRPNASDYEIIFAIISSSEKDLEIPFFSKVSLRNAKRRLETYGYKVALQKIKTEKQEQGESVKE